VPKVVDHEERRAELAGAVWQLVMREGIDAASVRRVAAQAGWSAGSLRHYFETRSELLRFAMELVVQRVSERVQALGPDAEPRALLHQVLPLDDERRAEMQVWLAFTMQALVDPDLGELRDAAHAALRDLCARAVGQEGAAAEQLHALVDGLALHAVLAPAVTTPERQVELLDGYLGGRSPSAAAASVAATVLP
jgi:AcrR family transcriptional regulator